MLYQKVASVVMRIVDLTPNNQVRPDRQSKTTDQRQDGVIKGFKSKAISLDVAVAFDGYDKVTFVFDNSKEEKVMKIIRYLCH